MVVSPQDYVAGFWQDHYLRTFIARGGSKIKFLVGKSGSGKTECLDRYLANAAACGLKTVYISAKRTWLHDFRFLYSEVFGAIDFEGCLRACADKVVLAMGYQPEDIPRSMTFTDYLVSKDSFDPLTKREIRAHLSSMFFENTCMDNNFAIASALLTGGILGYPMLESVSHDLLLSWLSVEKGVRIASLRKLGLSPSRITRHNARHMLRSLMEVIHMAGFAGLALAIDDMEILAEVSSLEEIRYTKMRREDAYESIRETIDDIDTLSHLMIVFAMDRELMDDEIKGPKSYQALWMRIQNEIAAEQVNCFSDIIDIDLVARQLKHTVEGEVL